MFVRSPTITNPVSGRDPERLEPAQRGVAIVEPWGPRARATSLDRVGDHADVLGRGAAASAHDVHQPRPARTPPAGRSWSRASRRSRRTRSGDRRSGSSSPGSVATRARSSTYGRISVAPSEQLTPDDHGLGVLDRGPERLDRLARQRAPAPVDDRHRQPAREVGRHVHGRRDGRLRVQGVEDRLDQQEVDAAVAEARGSARRTPRTPGRTRSCGTRPRPPWATWRA